MGVDTKTGIKTGIIYCWRNTHNGKRYIGQTTHPKRRYHTHKHHLGNYSGQNLFGRALNKYSSIDDWEYTVIEEVPTSQLDTREIYWIAFYDSMNPECGYNLREGGHNSYGYTPPDEVRRKISEALRGKPGTMNGKHHTEETKKKISEANRGRQAWNKGKQPTEETRRKLSMSHKGKTTWMKGKKCSAETRRKISEAHNPNRIAIYQNDTLIAICDTLKEAACLTDVSHSYVRLIASGKWSKTKSGYSFKYVNKTQTS